MASNQGQNDYRVGQLAKDFKLKTKDISELPGAHNKKSSSVLEPDEFSVMFDALTKSRQIDNIDDYLNKKVKIDKSKTQANTPLDTIEKKEEIEKDTTGKKDKEKQVKKEKQYKVNTTATKIEAKVDEETNPVSNDAETKLDTKPEVKKEMTDIKDTSSGNQNKSDNKVSASSSNEGRTQNQRSNGGMRPNTNGQNNGGMRQNSNSQNNSGNRPNTNGQNNGGNRPNANSQNNGGMRPNTNSQNNGGNRPNANSQNNSGMRPNINSQNNSGNRLNNANSQNQNNNTAAKSSEPVVNNNTYIPPANPKPREKQPEKEGKKRTGNTRVVDTRTTTVDLSKYDERLDHYVDDKDTGSQKQKLKKQNNRDSYGSNRERNNKERIAMEKLKKANQEKFKKIQISVQIPDEISVGELASRLKITVGDLIKRLMKLGVMATVNEVVDFDTAYLIADEMGIKVNHEVVVTIEEKLFNEEEDDTENLEERSPVVVVMGHVDHGKTSLLDAIRNANVTSGEAGGITQHIGAYRVRVNDKDITFLDTPGHEAFTAMRARGAKATDIAILVVAADDGIMPQTVEAINHAKAAGIDIVVAINKMDKPTANPDMIKQELTNYELVPEEWGGDVICVPVSAVTHEGIDDLLENVLLVAEMRELKANPHRRAKGIVIEAKLDKGRGPVATLLVQNGTLHAGDIVIAGTAVGRVRAMINDKGDNLQEAGPSVPVEITGLAEVPLAGDEFNAVEDERMARELAEQRREAAKEELFKANAKVNLDDLFAQISEGIKELNIIVKADVGGSAEAVKASLEKLSNEEVRVKVIHSAVGGITEGDVMLAAASNAIIVGFNVRPDKGALDSAERQNVEIRTYRIIYECIEEISAAMKGMLAPTFKEVLLGHAEVRQTIKVPNVGTIAGSYVQDGKVTRSSQIRIVRDGIVIFEDRISSLRRFKDDVREVQQGYECGIGLEKFNDIHEGDILESFVMEEVAK